MKISFLVKKMFHIYGERLFHLDVSEKNQPPQNENISFVEISHKNLYHIQIINKGVKMNIFKKMLSYGDIGIYITYDSLFVGYGWAKLKGSKDYFFHINNCYLCRFYVSPSYRGKGLYPLIINQLIDKIKKENEINIFYIAAEFSNTPSINGLKKLGFKLYKDIYFVRILKNTLNKYRLKQ